jgi:hypothetical protein
MKIHNSIKLKGILLVCLVTACSNPVQRPSIGKAKSANAGGGTDNPHSGTKTPPKTVDTQALKQVSEQILSAQNSSCSSTATGAAAEPILRLLTKVEYNNSIASILNLKTNYAADFPVEQRILGFKNNATTNVVSDSHMDAYLNVARVIAKEFIATNFQAVVGCPVSGGEACVNTLINGVGAKLWRRPIEKAESTRMLALYNNFAAESPATGFEVLIQALLSSSNFLYRAEIGAGGKLTAHETAQALSYFLWGSVPDDELRKLADSGAILTSATLLAQANRLLADPRAKIGLKEFADAFLRYDVMLTVPKDQAKFPQYSAEVKSAMALEAENSFDYWIRVKGIKFEDLFTVDYSAGSPALGAFYGAQTSQDQDVQVINWANQKRRGVLGLGSVMASLANTTDSNPIKRGTFVREHLLCEILPQPTGLDIPPVPVTPGLSTRERFAAHTAVASCKACHVRIDSVGFGMEDYDAVGLIRDNDAGKALDSSGSIVDLDGKDHSFNGVDGISAVLKDSERAKRCFVLQAFREAAGRFETAGDVCAIRAIANDFVQKDSTLADVLIKIITNPSLLKRRGL